MGGSFEQERQPASGWRTGIRAFVTAPIFKTCIYRNIGIPVEHVEMNGRQWYNSSSSTFPWLEVCMSRSEIDDSKS